MSSFLLPVIYIAFISLGLPDSILGAAWPVMQIDLSAPLEAAGLLTMIIAAGTIVSSLFTIVLTKKLGVGLVTAISVALTALALLGFSLAPSFIFLCIFAVPYGLGAGAVDSALNNYVALHYKARHMSWLHCFWGIGASLGPYIMGLFLTGKYSWHGGYMTISFIQIALTTFLFINLPMWNQKSQKNSGIENSQQSDAGASLQNAESDSGLTLKGLPFILIAFFAYCAMESTTGLWASSYLVNHRAITPQTAARLASLFYLGITAGRFINGFITMKVNDRILTRAGIFIAAAGICLIAIPFKSSLPAFAGLIITGIGCAPIYPSIIHSTPANFGTEKSQTVISLQMACAYTGTTFMPPIFGLLAAHINIALYPFYLLALAFLILAGTEILNRIKAAEKKQKA